VTLGATGQGQLNTYTGGTGGTFKWPNAGAWAGFYSFVTCSDSDSGGFNAIYGSAFERLMISNFNMDYRHDSSTSKVCIRGNVRKVGSTVQHCNPGVHTPPSGKCTWNWNFNVQNSFSDTTGFLDYSLPVSSRSSGLSNPSNPLLQTALIHIQLRGPGPATLNDAITSSGSAEPLGCGYLRRGRCRQRRLHHHRRVRRFNHSTRGTRARFLPCVLQWRGGALPGHARPRRREH